MDIRKWLGETVQPEPVLWQNSEPFRSKHVDSASTRKHRVHGTSDSSLLDVPCRQASVLSNKGSRPNERNANEHTESDDSQSSYSNAAGADSSRQRYARRPRHKTRPERYDPSHRATGEQRNNAHHGRPGESKKSRHKPKRKKAEKLGRGAIHDFHAKNVSKDRLTLRPLENLGIFNKGKTSTRVKGNGLPDLVFSEMAFLKKNREHGEPVIHAVTSRKKQKRDHAQNKDEEISAFFTSVRPALADPSRNSQATAHRLSSSNSMIHEMFNCKRMRERELDGSSRVNVVVPTVEKQGRTLYMGSGNRGSCHESASQISWSESHRTLSRMPENVLVVPTVGAGFTNSRGRADGEHLQHPYSKTNGNKARATEELFRVSSLHSMPNDLARLQSCPPPIPSPHRLNFGGEGGACRVVDDCVLPAELSSDLPVCLFVDSQSSENANTSKTSTQRRQSILDNQQQTLPVDKQQTAAGEIENATANAQTSFDLRSVLQECVDAVREQYCADELPEKYTTRTVRFHPFHEQEWRNDAGSTSIAQEAPTMRLPQASMPSSRVPNFARPGIYELQAQQSRTRKNLDWDPSCLEQNCIIGDDEDGFDIEDWEGMLEEPVWYDAVDDAPSRASEDGVNNGVAAQNVEQLAVLDSTIGTSQFWRPNRLY